MAELEGIVHGARMIVAIVPKGKGKALATTLQEQKGIRSVNFHHARGVGRMAPLSQRGIGEQREKDVIEVIVPADQADDIMAFLYQEAGIEEHRTGIIYTLKIPRTSVMTMPEVPEPKFNEAEKDS